ncbi:MAG: MBL fold metallo-hydrolase [Rhizobiaceae bacterium]
MLRFEVGDITVTEICDIRRFEIPVKTLFPLAEPERLAADLDWLSPDFIHGDLARLVVRSWLLKLNGRNILIDTCVGDHKERPNRPEWHRRSGGAWLSELARSGVGPQDIDIVFCTHLHADHVGWNTKLSNGRWVPTFPNARYITSRTEFDFWQSEVERLDGAVGHGSFTDSVLPIMEERRLDLVQDGWQLGDGLILHSSPGHTPGHMSLEVSRQGDRAVFSGDAIHSPMQILAPEWSSAFCSDPDQARLTRITLLQRLAESGELLVPMHFGGIGRCHVIADGHSFRPDFG